MADSMLPRLVSALSKCTFLPASWDKRFVNDMLGRQKFSQKQADAVRRLVHKYHRQMPAELLAFGHDPAGVPAGDNGGAP